MIRLWTPPWGACLTLLAMLPPRAESAIPADAPTTPPLPAAVADAPASPTLDSKSTNAVPGRSGPSLRGR